MDDLFANSPKGLYQEIIPDLDRNLMNSPFLGNVDNELHSSCVRLPALPLSEVNSPTACESKAARVKPDVGSWDECPQNLNSNSHEFENFENIFTVRNDNAAKEPKNELGAPEAETFFENKALDSPFKKRLNGLDGNMLVEHFSQRDEKKTRSELLFSKLFPVIYKKKIVADALNELTTLSKIARDIVTKKIPYGEQDATYEDLITYLSSASSIHAKLKRKI